MANVSFTAPGTEFLADQEEIKRRQKMAEILQAQADTPLQTNRMAGGYVVPISPFEGLAKMLQGGMAGYERQTAEQKQKYLTQKASTERQKALADALRLAQGTPESQYEDSMGIGRTQPAQKPDLAAALQRLAGSSDPALQQVGMSGMLQRFVPKEAKWQPTERFNEKTGRAEKVLVNLNDPSQIIPLGGQKAGELHFADNGGTIQGLDKTTGAPVGAPVQKTMSPGETARLDWDKFQWGNASPLQLANLGVDQARLANQGIQTQFDTGRGVGTPMVPRLPQAQMPQIGGTNFAPTQNLGAPANQPGAAPQVAPQAPVAPQRPPMAPAPQGAPVAAPGGTAVPPAMSGVMTPKARAQLAAEQAQAQQKAASELPDYEAKAKQTLSVVDQLLKHPGFSDVVGATWRPGMRFVQGSDAAGADALFNQMKGQQFLQAFESLKGGGQITEVEGKKATDAISRMSRSQSEADFREAAKEFMDVVQGGLDRAYQKAGKQVPQRSSGPIGKPDINALLKKYGG